MDLNSTAETIGISELICDISAEQALEGDFNIPDYQPEIFKIVKTKAQPVIVQKIASGTRVTIDGYVKVTVIYQTSEDKRLFGLMQKLPFSKQLELKSSAGDANLIFCKAKISYLNCRAVNQRRIDARGALTLSVRVLAQSNAEAVSELEGDGIYQQRTTAEYIKEIACEQKQFTLDEMLSVDYDGCETPVILRCDSEIRNEAVTVESGRAIASGYVNIQLAFDISTESEYKVKRVGFNLPYNQVIDLSLTDTDYIAACEASIVSCGASVEEDNSANAMITCDVEIHLFQKCTATLVSDAFSTAYELVCANETASLNSTVHTISESFGVRFTVQKNAQGRLIDFFVENAENTLAVAEGKTLINGTSVLCYMLCGENSETTCYEQPFEYSVGVNTSLKNIANFKLETLFSTVECMDSETTLSAKCEGILMGFAADNIKQAIIKSIKADETKPKSRPNAALCVYYPDKNETVWDIAKRFNTSPDEIAENNELQDGAIIDSNPLLIPIVV